MDIPTELKYINIIKKGAFDKDVPFFIIFSMFAVKQGREVYNDGYFNISSQTKSKINSYNKDKFNITVYTLLLHNLIHKRYYFDTSTYFLYENNLNQISILPTHWYILVFLSKRQVARIDT